MIALILAAAATLAAGDSKPARLNNPDLNCKAGFPALVDQTRAQHGVVEVPSETPSLVVFRSPSEKAIYTVTRKTHPAYPAIVRQKIAGGPGSGAGGAATVQTLTCSYGDRAATRRFVDELTRRHAALIAQVESGHSPFQQP